MPFNFIARNFVFLPFSFDVYDMGMSGALDLNDKKKELMASQMEWNQFNLIDAMIIFQGEKCHSGKIYERKLYWRIVAFSDAFHELTYLALFSCRRIFVHFASLFREESSSLSLSLSVTFTLWVFDHASPNGPHCSAQSITYVDFSKPTRFIRNACPHREQVYDEEMIFCQIIVHFSISCRISMKLILKFGTQ